MANLQRQLGAHRLRASKRLPSDTHSSGDFMKRREAPRDRSGDFATPWKEAGPIKLMKGGWAAADDSSLLQQFSTVKEKVSCSCK
jgi:hypothetical protein